MDIYRWAEKKIGGRLIRLHDTVYQKTDGRIGHRIPGVPPILLLHTIGAKTGLPRTNSLTYARDGDAYLIVASNGGSDPLPGLVSQPAQEPERRNQRRRKAIQGCTRAKCHPGGLRLSAAVADRQQEQLQPVQATTSTEHRGHIPIIRAQSGRLEQLFRQQLQRRLAARRGGRVGAAPRRRNRMDHDLVDVEPVRQRAHLLGGLRRGADDRARKPGVDDRLLGRAELAPPQRPRRGRADRAVVRSAAAPSSAGSAAAAPRPLRASARPRR